MAPESPCKFQRFSCILQCTLRPIFMITTPEVHTSLLSLVPIHTLFIIREFGSGKCSNASMYVCVCAYVCVCVYFLSPLRLLLTEQNSKCNPRDQICDVMLRKYFCAKYLCRHIIDNYSRDLRTSNFVKSVSQPEKAPRSKRQLLKAF